MTTLYLIVDLGDNRVAIPAAEIRFSPCSPIAANKRMTHQTPNRSSLFKR